jgi:hypothetical protein
VNDPPVVAVVPQNVGGPRPDDVAVGEDERDPSGQQLAVGAERLGANVPVGAQLAGLGAKRLSDRRGVLQVAVLLGADQEHVAVDVKGDQRLGVAGVERLEGGADGLRDGCCRGRGHRGSCGSGWSAGA